MRKRGRGRSKRGGGRACGYRRNADEGFDLEGIHRLMVFVLSSLSWHIELRQPFVPLGCTRSWKVPVYIGFFASSSTTCRMYSTYCYLLLNKRLGDGHGSAGCKVYMSFASLGRTDICHNRLSDRLTTFRVRLSISFVDLGFLLLLPTVFDVLRRARRNFFDHAGRLQP